MLLPIGYVPDMNLSIGTACRDMGAQGEAIPMCGNIVVGPEHGGDRFLAHLLRYGHPAFLDLAVCVIGAGADPQLVVMLQQHELHLTA